MKFVIRLTTESLSFSMFENATTNKIVCEECRLRQGMSAAANLRQAFAESSLDRSRADGAIVIVDTPTMLIPLDEYEDNDTEKIYARIFSPAPSESVSTVVLPAQNAVAAFTVNKDLKTVVGDNFKTFEFMPLMQPVWNYLYRRSFTGSRRKLFVYLHDRKADVVSYRQTHFRFCNTFPAENVADTIYYILNVWKELGLDNTKDELHITGGKKETEELATAVREYLKNVYLLNPAADFGFTNTPGLRDLPFDLQVFYVKNR